MKVIDAHPDRRDWIGSAVEYIRKGSVIAYPTETVYGLGGEMENRQVVDRIRKLKGRTEKSPFLVLIGDRSWIQYLTVGDSDQAKILMNYFWPGPLTLIFRANPSRARYVVSDGNIGIRLSPDPVCRALFEVYNQPLISTSANLSGLPPARHAGAVQSYFKTGIDLLLNGGARESGDPSTVVDVSTNQPRFIREGSVTREQIENILGKSLHDSTL